MKKCKIESLIAGLSVCVLLLGGCGAPENTGGTEESSVSEQKSEDSSEASQEETGAPEEASEPERIESLEEAEAAMIQGYYSYVYPVDGLGDFSYYFHFYPEAPVLGRVFYAGFAMNQINFAGTYSVEEKEYEYACFATREEQTAGNDPTKGVAPYTITFYDWEGNEIDHCGFDGYAVYNDMKTIAGVGGENITMTHDIAGEQSPYLDSYNAEVGMPYLEFVGEDPTATLVLYHNSTYMDLVNMMVEGAWEMVETEEGYQFVLTPDSTSETGAVLTVTKDKMTASYQPDGGEEVNLFNTSSMGPAVLHTMTGIMPFGEDNVDAVAVLYDDDTCTVTISAFGQEMQIDQGTYTVSEDGTLYTFMLDTAGEISSEPDEETGMASIHYYVEETPMGTVDMILVMQEN